MTSLSDSQVKMLTKIVHSGRTLEALRLLSKWSALYGNPFVSAAIDRAIIEIESVK